MAKVTGPLFSLDARGRVGDSLVFSKQRGTNYTKKHTIPTNPQTAAQTRQRMVTAFCTKLWSHMTDAEKATWAPLAAELNLSPYHACLKTNLHRLRSHQAPTLTAEPTGGFDYTYISGSWSGNWPTKTRLFVIPNGMWGRLPDTPLCAVLYKYYSNGMDYRPYVQSELLGFSFVSPIPDDETVCGEFTTNFPDPTPDTAIFALWSRRGFQYYCVTEYPE